jgi:molybdate transport system ATP-binding protein
MAWSVRIEAKLREFTLAVELGGDNAPLALVGPNGSGKTAILRMIAGVATPNAGSIVLSGYTAFDAAEKVNVPPEGRRVGYVPQGYGLFPHLSALQNVAFGLQAQRFVRGFEHSSNVTWERALAALTELGCERLANANVRELSGGERQRIALARALVIEPRLLLLDEPLAALDVAVRRSVRLFLAEHLSARGCPLVVTTHDVRDVITLGCQVCVLDRGQVIQTGSVAELRRAPANEFVAEFVGLE